jgi:curved DNA-binding protein CbpA
MDLAFEMETEALVQVLETLDYFQVLKLPQTATPVEIKEAFYRESRLYHPDRYNSLPPCAIKDQSNYIYKRVAEAYVTLRDDRKRQKYLQDINGPDREKRLRFTEEAEKEAQAEKKKQIEEQFGQTPKGRQLYQQAVKELEAGKADAAVRSMKMAVTFEPSNEKFKELLRAAEKKIVRDFRVK